MVVVIVVFCAALSLAKTEIINISSADVDKSYKVIIDAGHGGFDGGAVSSDGTVEKDINLAIAKQVSDILRLNGVEVIMTRISDTGTEDDPNQSIAVRKKSDLYNRLSIMDENPDAVFVSIHLNKFTTSAASGTQVFYSPDFKDARDLGECIQKSVVCMLQPENNRVVKQGSSKTFLLKNAQVPAVIVECGFISNSLELRKLKNEEYQSKMAFAVSVGILDFLNNY